MERSTFSAVSAGRGTAIGGAAILMWAGLAPLAVLVGPVPPFETIAIAFAIASLLGAAGAALRGRAPLGALRQKPRVWITGVGGLFGYHLLYFLALRASPPVAVTLINYLWPILIVLMSSALPGHRLRWRHLAGAGAGLLGTALLVLPSGGGEIGGGHPIGYLLAFAGACVWAGYSLASRRMPEVPTAAVGGFCLATAILAALCHLALEPTVRPAGAGSLAALLSLGLGPIGAAFYAWDYGVKHGDIHVLGALSYAAPLLSTIFLVALGRGEAGWRLWTAALLIIGGAALASRRRVASQER
jgi:drug/metabolite transporter (DMT)-like permease